MSILSGNEIRRRYLAGEIQINPYDPEKVQPNSVDVTLGHGVCVYSSVVSFDSQRLAALDHSVHISNALEHRPGVLDTKRQNSVYQFEMDESGWIVKPDILYLMHVNEVLCAPNLVMTLDGKSSLARLGIIIHFTAGHAETGFNGQYTMEVSAMHPVRIYPNMDIGQVIFTTVEGEVEDYKKRGNYVGEAAMGAQPSRSWRQFK